MGFGPGLKCSTEVQTEPGLRNAAFRGLLQITKRALEHKYTEVLENKLRLGS